MPGSLPRCWSKQGRRWLPRRDKRRTVSRYSPVFQPMSAAEVSTPERRIKRMGRDFGFDLVRITSSSPLLAEGAKYVKWIEEGHQGEMRWITREHAERCARPADVLPSAGSVVCVGLSYWAGHRPGAPQRGSIARYAWGRDYHQVLNEKLEVFAAQLREAFGGEYRWHVDTGPLMDKALASRSGLGWYGKNTNILTERFGSFLFLGEIVTSLKLEADAPLERNCGTCRLCVVACPTGALGPDYTIDATKCISYLTIELRASIPRELRPQVGSWVFGCDICQDVCPPAMAPYVSGPKERRAWAHETRAVVSRRSDAGGTVEVDHGSGNGMLPDTWRIGQDHRSLDLLWLLRLTHDEYLDAFRGTAIRRAKAWMLRRNAAVALGNIGDDRAIGPLLTAARMDEHPLVRGHAAWALGRLRERLRPAGMVEQLRELLNHEADATVRDEITLAIGDLVSL